MKVLHVLDTSVPDSAGYTTRGYYLVANQRKLGWQPVVLTSERFPNPGNITQEEIEGVGYYRSVKQRGMIRRIPFLAENHEIQTLRRRVAEVAAREQVDIIHAHSPSLIGAACLDYCQDNKVPLVYEIRAFWEDAAVDRGAFAEGSVKYRLRRYHETSIVKKATAVIAICDGIKADLLARGIPPEKIHVVRNGVDCQLFQPITPPLELKAKIGCAGKTIIGFIGSFFNFEGLLDLIVAMQEIARHDDKIVLLLVGKGQVDKTLREFVRANGLADRVIFTGMVPHDQVKDYYSIIDLLVYPRLKKRITDLVTPLKPLEAMAMGKAVLMSDVGGLVELASEPGGAEFFTAGDVGDLARKCIALCASSERRRQLGMTARNNMVAQWGWDKRARTDIGIYEQVLGR